MMKNPQAISLILLNILLGIYILALLKNYLKIQIFKDDYSFSELLEHQYCVHYNYREATESFRDADGLEPVSLVTHATSDMLEAIGNMTKMWAGPISAAIFVDLKSQKVLEYVEQLHRCDPEVRRKITFHVAYRKSSFQLKCPKLPKPTSSESCSDRHSPNLPSFFGLYPFGLMRNIARKGAKSDLHFVMDSDMIVSEGMAEKVKPIANKVLGDGKSKTVLVVRRFENVVGTELPRSVDELRDSMRRNSTFEFHHKYFFRGHKIPNLSGWFNRSQSSMDVSSWQIPYSNPDWEVQPILHRNSPLGPEYVPSRVKTMCSVIYKLCRAGYRFRVLSHVFNVQEGIKLDNTVYGNAIAQHQYTYARDRAQDRFMTELNDRYPETKQTCGDFVF